MAQNGSNDLDGKAREGASRPDDDGSQGSAAIIGTPGNDRLNAAPDGSRLLGLAGDDVLVGAAGEDVIRGGDGNDLVGGGGGDDRVEGGDGNDLVFGTGGNDRLSGDAGNDILAGGYDNDTISGGSGSDVFYFRFISGSAGATAVDGQDVLRDFTTGETLLLDDLVNGSREQQPLDLSTARPATDALGISVTSVGDDTVLGFVGGSIRLDDVSGYGSIGALQVAGYKILVG